MKVSKYDIGTCGASWVALQGVLGAWSMSGMAAAAQESGGGRGFYYNATCEQFSWEQRVNGDVCYSMPQQYRLYAVFHGQAVKV